jgi:hypothetical protein
VSISERKKIYISPSTMEGGLHTPHLSNGPYHPQNFSKPVKLPPEAILKNHGKSQKNHKIKKLIVLDSK